MPREGPQRRRVGKQLSGRLATVGCGRVAQQHCWKARASTAARTAREYIFFPLDRGPRGRAGGAHRGPGPPLCLAREIGIFVRVSDYDAGVVIRFVLAQRGTRVLDLGQRRGSRSPRGPLAAGRIFSQRLGTGCLGRRHSANFAITVFSEVHLGGAERRSVRRVMSSSCSQPSPTKE